MAENTITQDMYDADPTLAEQGLKVGDPVPKKVKKDVVEVDRSLLEGILKELETLREMPKQIENLKKDNEKLLSVADKGRLQNYEAKNNPGGLVRTARAWFYLGQFVKGTVTIRNQAFTDVNGRVHTDQVLNVIFEDGTEKEVTYDQFMKERTLIEGDIVKRSTDDQTSQTFYKLKFKDGKELDINYLFLN